MMHVNYVQNVCKLACLPFTLTLKEWGLSDYCNRRGLPFNSTGCVLWGPSDHTLERKMLFLPAVTRAVSLPHANFGLTLQREAELLLNFAQTLEAASGNCGCFGWNTKRPQKQESHVVVWGFQYGAAGPQSLHYATFLCYISRGAAGQERCANAVRDKGLASLWTARKGGRELRWREEAGANQLWFSVSCWELHRERGCSCGLGRSVKPKKCYSHYTFSSFLFLLIITQPSPSFSLSCSLLFHFPSLYSVSLPHVRSCIEISVLIKPLFGPFSLRLRS